MLTLSGCISLTHNPSPPLPCLPPALTTIRCPRLFAHISEKRPSGKVIIAFHNDFMLRHTVTPNHGPLIPREQLLWEKMRRKQSRQQSEDPCSVGIDARFHISPHLPIRKNAHVFIPFAPFDSQAKRGRVMPVPKHRSLLSAFEGMSCCRRRACLLSRLTVSEERFEHQ